jgi:hypothetical protein
MGNEVKSAIQNNESIETGVKIPMIDYHLEQQKIEFCGTIDDFNRRYKSV